MEPYKEMYYQLFRSVTKTIALLQEAQLKTEELYVNTEDTPLILANRPSFELENRSFTMEPDGSSEKIKESNRNK